MVGVSGLGVGVRDGDVLTEVDGAPATSVEAVVRAVVAARSARAAAVGGRFFRDGESFALVVEMPYVD
jgi:S1-C subfamily serine protease